MNELWKVYRLPPNSTHTQTVVLYEQGRKFDSWDSTPTIEYVRDYHSKANLEPTDISITTGGMSQYAQVARDCRDGKYEEYLIYPESKMLRCKICQKELADLGDASKTKMICGYDIFGYRFDRANGKKRKVNVSFCYDCFVACAGKDWIEENGLEINKTSEEK